MVVDVDPVRVLVVKPGGGAEVGWRDIIWKW